jgi:hypothetical protein
MSGGPDPACGYPGSPPPRFVRGPEGGDPGHVPSTRSCPTPRRADARPPPAPAPHDPDTPPAPHAPPHATGPAARSANAATARPGTGGEPRSSDDTPAASTAARPLPSPTTHPGPAGNSSSSASSTLMPTNTSRPDAGHATHAAASPSSTRSPPAPPPHTPGLQRNIIRRERSPRRVRLRRPVRVPRWRR